MGKVLGILGGMGPLASAEFMKTIYEFNIAGSEQQMPTCLLYSDPTIPDRTAAILEGRDDLIVPHLTGALEQLCRLGVSRIVIACVTAHYFLPRLPAELRDKIVSLVDLTLEHVVRSKQPQLLLCTHGTRKVGIFQQHPKWRLAAPYILFPRDDDQGRIHTLIYQIKQGKRYERAIPELDALLERYGTRCFIAGCTELHLLTKHLLQGEYECKPYGITDPLLIVATELRRFINT